MFRCLYAQFFMRNFLGGFLGVFLGHFLRKFLGHFLGNFLGNFFITIPPVDTVPKTKTPTWAVYKGSKKKLIGNN